MNGVSGSVLDALARALQLDDAERAHLLRPRPRRTPDAGAAAPRATPSSASGPRSSGPSTRSPAPPRSCATTASTSSPPTSSDTRSTPSCTPRPPRPVEQRPLRVPRPASRDVLPRLGPRRHRHRRDPARRAAGRDPYDRELSDLVGELATQSDAFRTRWAAHNVRFHNTGVKHFHHPVVGDLTLSFNRFDLAADPGLTMFTYTAEPGSRSEDALKLLGSWAATVDPAEPRVRPTRVEATRDTRSERRPHRQSRSR